jgi:hypothetical protein
MFDHSSTSIRAELDYARGWLDSSRTPVRREYWEVNAEAGALGALANAWGRLTLWTRAGDIDVNAGQDLAQAMDALFELRRQLGSRGPTAEDLSKLRDVLDRLEGVYQRAREASGQT